MTKFFRGDENFVRPKFCPMKNFVRRKFCPKIKFYVLASFDRFNTLQIWNMHIRLPSDVKSSGWSDGNCKKKKERKKKKKQCKFNILLFSFLY